jgi:hypothetical protein
MGTTISHYFLQLMYPGITAEMEVDDFEADVYDYCSEVMALDFLHRRIYSRTYA